jgi:RluA family pseudouridine synthase
MKYNKNQPSRASAKEDKVYKLLALQEKISNQEAKKYCDRGLVYIENKKVKIARAVVPANTKFKIQEVAKLELIYEDDNLIVLNKPPFLTSDDCLKKYKKAQLLHRLDKETSGILLLAKNEEFRQKVIQEFKNNRVYKEYVAIVFGVVNDEETISEPLFSEKNKKTNQIRTKVSKNGKSAITHIEPIEIIGKKTKLSVVIETGRTHQIRVHLAHIGHPVVGDEIYGGSSRARRLMLHAKKVGFLDYNFEITEDSDIAF